MHVIDGILCDGFTMLTRESFMVEETGLVQKSGLHKTRKQKARQQKVRRLRQIFLASILAVAPLVVIDSAAQAQWLGYGPYGRYAPPVVMEEMSPRELAQVVRAQGFGKPSQPVYHDEVAIVTASTSDGRRVRLTIDAFSGQILGSTLLAPARPRPQREHPTVVQRVPDQGAAIRRSVPDQDKRVRATPEKPTIVRRQPMLPAPQTSPGVQTLPGAKSTPTEQTPALKEQQSTAPAAGSGNTVGSGTKTSPRKIEMVPPAELDSSQKTPLQSTTPPI